MDKKLVVMTYNLRLGGEKLGYNSTKIAGLMAVASPDVIFVQETYSGQVSKIAKALSKAQNRKIYYAFAGTRTQFKSSKTALESDVPFDGRFGHAIFSRYPFIDHKIVSLPATKAEDRALLSARISINGKQMRLLGTHLINNSDKELREEDRKNIPLDYILGNAPGKSPRSWIRAREAEYIRDYIRTLRDESPLILAGDFNTEYESEVFQNYLNQKILYATDGRKTTIMKSGKPTKLYDHILFRNMPAIKSVTNFVPSKEPYISASDHLPSVTTFQFY